ncbi:MAG: hypothetical protein WCZ65_00735 [Lysobacteraceae bacterium]
MTTLTMLLFLAGAFVAGLNFHFSALCTLTFRLREGHWPPVVPVGIPALGTALLLGAILLAGAGSGITLVAGLLALADTGGPLFVLAFVRYRRRRARAQLPKLDFRLP